jgi:hypothetical protein
MSAPHQDLVNAWLAAHGGPRRFGRGESTDFFTIQRWLKMYGFVLSSREGSYFVRASDDECKKLKWPQVIDLVDTIRAATGLETIRPRA